MAEKKISKTNVSCMMEEYIKATKELGRVTNYLWVQASRKPIVHHEFKGEIDFDCPTCGTAFAMEKADLHKFCPYCGTRYDWEEEQWKN